jgi:hypothetical protein
MPPFRRLLVSGMTLFLSLAALRPVGTVLAAPGAGGPAALDPVALIAGEFPDRKTSAYDSQRLVSYLSGQLQSRGWTAEVLPYSMLVRATASNSPNTRFVQVTGEDVLAYRVPPSQSNGVDILIVAPYDLLFKEADDPALASYTARATSLLLDTALGLGPAGANPTLPGVVVAFVSGHYQYGAGVRALLDELERRGASVSAAVVIGDVDALSSLPLTVSDSTPVAFAQAVYRLARQSGLQVTLVGPRAREALYRAFLSAQTGVFSGESVFDNGEFRGEATVLAAKGIPAVTIGTPRNNLAAARMPSPPGKAQKVAALLHAMLTEDSSGRGGLGAGLWANLTRGPAIGEEVVLQVAGDAFFVPGKTLQIAAAVLGIAALAVLRLDVRRRKDLAPLALLGGILAVSAVSHVIKDVWFSGNKTQAMILHPASSLFLYVWSTATLVTLGFLRIWRIRSRIALLHSRYPLQPLPPGAGISGRAGLDGADESFAPQGPPPDTSAAPGAPGTGGEPRSWAGSWGLAATMAILAGMSILGSEMAPPAMLAVLCMTIAVALDRAGSRPWAAWLQRVLCAASLLPLVFWAGSPFTRDGLLVYASAMGSLGIESASFTVSTAVLAACLISTFHLPRPASPRGRRLMTLAELGLLALFVTLGLAIPGTDGGVQPAQAMVKEFYGTEGRFTLDTTRPLGRVAMLPASVQSRVSDFPSELANQVLSENVRLSLLGTPSTWADIRLFTGPPEKGQEETRYVGEVRASFAEKPTFYEVRFTDAPYARTLSRPFRLSNLAQILGGEGRPSQVDLAVEPVASYSITVAWWMPKESPGSVPLDISLTPSFSRVDVTGRAVYLDRSYSGAMPSAGDARFYQMTTVTGQSGLR